MPYVFPASNVHPLGWRVGTATGKEHSSISRLCVVLVVMIDQPESG